LRLWRNVTPRS